MCALDSQLRVGEWVWLERQPNSHTHSPTSSELLVLSFIVNVKCKQAKEHLLYLRLLHSS